MEKAKFHEKEEFRNDRHVFGNRSEAGRVLAEMMEPHYGEDPATQILAIPAGGVPVGIEISNRLKLPFDLIIVRKIQIPGNTEAGFGAMDPEGNVYLNEELLEYLRLSPAQIESQKARVRKDLEERDRLFRGGKAFPNLRGKTVILVDDGIASGYTMLASIHAARGKGARSIVVAVPPAHSKSLARVEPLVEAVYCPNIRTTPHFAVADAYTHWYDISRDEVLKLLERE